MTRHPPSGPWWRDAVFYEVYVRSFADASGDGVGDLDGIRTRLGYLRDLGVDALWLTPFYPSPGADHGYDVADPCAVDPMFGSLADFDRLLAAAHEAGLRVTVDVVPNHFSDQHPWFREALRDGPGSPARSRFLFRDGRGRDGSRPPNNWRSTFGGSAWTRVPDGQWYLHLFAPQQPDLDWRNPEVVAEFDRVLRFWLDRGVDGFRIDVAHGLFKDAALPDNPTDRGPDLLADELEFTAMWNQPEVHEVYRRWHRLVADYPDDPVLVGEVWIGDPDVVARYLRPDELDLAFNFRLLKAPWGLQRMRAAIQRSLVALGEVGAPSTWVLSNHDVERHLSRYGGDALGLRRSRAAVLLLLALPGPVFLYAGEELGLPEVRLPDEVLQDPVWERSGHADRGRDGCRVPLPWSGDVPPYGFSAAGVRTWLPQPDGWGPLTVAQQHDDPASLLSLYRTAIALRRRLPAFGDGELLWCRDAPGAIAFDRPARRGGAAVRCLVNFGPDPLPLPAGEVLLASEPEVGGVLPPDVAAWVATD